MRNATLLAWSTPRRQSVWGTWSPSSRSSHYSKMRHRLLSRIKTSNHFTSATDAKLFQKEINLKVVKNVKIDTVTGAMWTNKSAVHATSNHAALLCIQFKCAQAATIQQRCLLRINSYFTLSPSLSHPTLLWTINCHNSQLSKILPLNR